MFAPAQNIFSTLVNLNRENDNTASQLEGDLQNLVDVPVKIKNAKRDKVNLTKWNQDKRNTRNWFQPQTANNWKDLQGTFDENKNLKPKLNRLLLTSYRRSKTIPQDVLKRTLKSLGNAEGRPYSYESLSSSGVDNLKLPTIYTQHRFGVD